MSTKPIPRQFISLGVLPVIIIISFLWVETAEAANRYWVGARNANNDRWEDTENWSTQPKGASGASIPGASDIAIFSASGNTVRLRSAVSVAGIAITSTWTGSILQGTGTLTVGASNFKMGSGTFVGGNAAISVSGGFTQTGGIVRGIQNTMSIGGAFSITNGGGSGIPSSSFTSTGTLTFNGSADQTFTKGAGATMDLTNLTLNNTGGGTSDDIVANINGGLNLSGALTVTLGNLDLTTNSVAMVVERGITLADAAQASLTTNSNVTASGTILVNDSAVLSVTAGTWTLNDDGDQSVDFDNQRLYNLTINNGGGGTIDDITINGGGLTLSGALTITLGNLDLDTSNQTLITEGGITIANAAQATLVSDANITSSGSISTGAAGSFTLSGSMTLTMNGIDQNLDTNNTITPSLTIASSSGTTLTNGERVSGTLQVNTGSTLALSTFTLGATGATIINYATIAENTGKIVHTPSTFIVANSSYAEVSSITLGNTVYFSLNEGDENVDGTTADTVSITATIPNGESETITLTETSNFSGIFRGSIASADVSGGSVTASNGKLEAPDTSTLTITFTDAQDGISSTDTATLADSGTSSTTTTTTSSGGGGGGSGRRTTNAIQQGAIRAVDERRYLDERNAVDTESETTSPQSPWSDFSESHPHAYATLLLYDAGIVKGNDDGTIQLDRTLSRAEALTLLVRTLGKEEKPMTELPFHDIDYSAWYGASIQIAYDEGYVRGFPDGSFRPAARLNIVQSLKLLSIALGLATQEQETRAMRWYDPYVTAGRQAKLVVGELDLERFVTRGEFFSWLVIILDQKDTTK